MYKRRLDLSNILKHKSLFLFGARATGKTTLVQNTLPQARLYDLLDAEIFRRLLLRPKLIEEEYQENDIIVIDEIQKLPALLDEVHRLIQRHDMRFLLTGSSARKLKAGGANLLAGRAWIAHLFPLTYAEINDFDLLRYLNQGGLPLVTGSPFANEELRSYVGTYLKEEIQAEAVTRNVLAFSEFLDIIATHSGAEINYEKLASDTQVSPSTIKNYLQILEDTLIGFSVKGFTKTSKRKATSRSKFFLFDIGVTNYLCRRGQIFPKSELFGKAFEHFIFLEVRAYLSYSRKDLKMYYWRSTSGFEVDLIIDSFLAIEIKAVELVQDKHLKGIRALKEEEVIEQFLIVSCDPADRNTSDSIKLMYWQSFLERLWTGELI